jgi:hypothetical protein
MALAFTITAIAGAAFALGMQFAKWRAKRQRDQLLAVEDDMAQFRGTIQGTRGAASRLGDKRSGLRVEAQSWQGKIVVELWHDEEQGIDRYKVSRRAHMGVGWTEAAPIAEGVLVDFGEG